MHLSSHVHQKHIGRVVELVPIVGFMAHDVTFEVATSMVMQVQCMYLMYFIIGTCSVASLQQILITKSQYQCP